VLAKGVIILAAGKGTRMGSEQPKVCCEFLGRSMIQRVVDTCLEIEPDLLAVVIGYKKELVVQTLQAESRIQFAIQKEQNGTGDAVLAAREIFAHFHGAVLIVCGDIPLLKAATLNRVLAFHHTHKAQCTVLTMFLDNPGKYGRIVRDLQGKIQEIVEFKDADQEIRKINEINTGIYCFNADILFDFLDKLDTNNAQHEYYLTDVLQMMYKEKMNLETIELDDIYEAAGVNSPDELAALEKIAQQGTYLLRAD